MEKNIENCLINSTLPHKNILMAYPDSPGPQGRNLRTWEHLWMILKGGSTRDTRTKLKLKMKEYEWRRIMNVLNAMKMEYEHIVDDDVAGVAIFDFLFKEEKGRTFLNSVLLLFHNGEVLFLRNNRSKKKVCMYVWKDPMDDSELKELDK